ncbi:acyltransferase [uncultured Algibacter sp.]|uniref:acyltransferase n=1 Tax=uncultured Algibacter sp. TaxID=298659 RepID=UPI00321788C3
MASITYLWANRAKFSPTSINFYRAWGKRFFLLPDLIKKNYRLLKLKRLGANINGKAEIGEITLTGNNKLLSVGAFSFLGKINCALHEKITIGNNVCISDGVTMLTGSHDIFDPKWPHKKGSIIVDDYVWIGTEATILPGVHLERGSVVGARAVVSKSLKPGEIVVGNPAKILTKKRLIEFKYNPCEFLANNKAWLIG